MKKPVAMQLRRWIWTICLVMIVIGINACTSGEAPSDTAAPETDAASPTATATTESEQSSSLDPATANLPVLEGTATVEIQVNGGRIVMELDGQNAPITAGNFVDLVQRGVYDDVAFHRVVKSPEPFVAQGGDPQSKDASVPERLWGTGSFIDPDTGQPRLIPLEIKPTGADQPIYGQTFEMAGIQEPPVLSHTRGAVAMARSQLPDSASSQFYIALADLPFLDGSYAVFGYVTEGMDVVDSIEQGDRIESATVTAGLENLKQPE